jgi:hypothetical protein
MLVYFLAYSATLKMETCSSATSVHFQRTIRRCIPVYRIHLHNVFYGRIYSSGGKNIRSTNAPIRKLTPCWGVLFEKLTVDHLITKSWAFYGTRAWFWTLNWSMWVQSETSKPISSRTILILFSYVDLGFEVVSFFQVFLSKYNNALLSCALHDPLSSSTLI